jgi:hypothetical protein
MSKAGAGTGASFRSVVVVGLAVLLAFQVVRSALVALPYEDRPGIAARVWPGHPAIVLDRSMGEIGAAAAKGQGVPAGALVQVREFAAKSPLSADPYLVEGAIAQSEGRPAERLFVEARARDPRSRGARYFLADQYFRTGVIARGLIEMAALSRLSPRAAAPFVPALVAYAREPGAVPQLGMFFRAMPELEPAVLSLLADDVRNADLVLALATTGKRSAPVPEWQGKLLVGLAAAGEYRKAREVWSRLSGVKTAPLLFNPDFEELDAPAPFNWSLPTTGDGVAEMAGGGILHVLYYGRQETVLASQLLLLPAGRYALAMQVSGDGAADTLQWTVRCANRDQSLLRLPVRRRQERFTVPPGNCPAQWLELRGLPGDIPRTAEMGIGKLRLDREARP